MSAPLAKWLPRVLVALAIALAVAHAFFYFARTVDDAFISLRYAERLVAGDGLTYNDGARVEGFSNPTWTLLQALLIALGVDGVVATKLLGLLSYAALLTLAWVFARRILALTRLTAAVALVALAASNYLASWALWGLETPLYLALLLAVVVALHAWREAPSAGHFIALVLVATAFVATRPEAPLYLLALGLTQVRYWRVLVTPGVAIGLVLVVLLLARYAYYGAWLPQTAVAKQAAGIDFTRLMPLFGKGAPTVEIVYVISALVAAIAMVRRSAIPLALVLANLFFVAAVIDDWMPNQRHFLPLFVLAPLLLMKLAEHRVLALTTTIVVVAQAFSSFTMDVRFSKYDFATHGHGKDWTRAKTAATWAEARDAFVRTPPAHMAGMSPESLGMIDQLFRVLEASATPERTSWYIGRDIGMVGYYSPVQILDTEALFTPLLTASPAWRADRTLDDGVMREAFATSPVTVELLDGWSGAFARRPDLVRRYDLLHGSVSTPRVLRLAATPRPSADELRARYRRVVDKAHVFFHVASLYGPSVTAAIEKRWQWLEPHLDHMDPMTVAAAPAGLSPPATLEHDRVRLHGCRLEPRSPTTAGLALACYWEALRPITRVLRTFVHAVAPTGGEPLAGGDHEPALGLLPTTAWRRGEIVRDVTWLVLPPGTWSLRVGLYNGAYRSSVGGEAADDDDRVKTLTVVVPGR